MVKKWFRFVFIAIKIPAGVNFDSLWITWIYESAWLRGGVGVVIKDVCRQHITDSIKKGTTLPHMNSVPRTSNLKHKFYGERGTDEQSRYLARKLNKRGK